MLKNIFLAGASRTPIGTLNGSLADMPAPKLGGVAIRAALGRAKVAPDQVDEVFFGNVISAGLGQNVARQATLAAGLPQSCGAATVNKVCGSGMRAIMSAAQAIQCGDADLVAAGGCESMTRAPYLLDKARSGYRLGNGVLIDAMVYDGLTDVYSSLHMGICAEKCAKAAGISRQEQDDFAVASFKRLMAAQAAGHFGNSITPVEIASKAGKTIVDKDEGAAKFNEEKLRQLKPAFDPNGGITAGNASQISDGAAAMIVVSEDRARSLGIPRQARILGYATAALAPDQFPMAPIHAMRKLSDKLSLNLAKVDLFEINEAFAVVTLAAMKELNLPHEKVNVLGGAVAMGHPIGASGARIVTTLIDALRTRGLKTGMASVCLGGGEAVALAIELC